MTHLTHQTVPTTFDKARALFRRHGGLLRTREALRLGIHPRTLYAMRDAGVLAQLSRGLYRPQNFRRGSRNRY